MCCLRGHYLSVYFRDFNYIPFYVWVKASNTLIISLVWEVQGVVGRGRKNKAPVFLFFSFFPLFFSRRTTLSLFRRFNSPALCSVVGSNDRGSWINSTRIIFNGASEYPQNDTQREVQHGGRGCRNWRRHDWRFVRWKIEHGKSSSQRKRSSQIIIRKITDAAAAA